jgi:aminopeptidase N
LTLNNLTRQEATERASHVRVASTTVELDLSQAPSRDAATYRSTTQLHFSSSSPGATTFVDLSAAGVHEVVLNGRPLDPTSVFDGQRIHLPELAAINELRIVADCAFMRTGEGLHRFFDPVDGNAYLYSHFETSDAQRMYACFDQPDLKSAFELTVIAPEGWEVVSNLTPDAGPEPTADGKARWHFPPSPRMSTYITALIAGPYHVVRDSYPGREGIIPLGLFCRQSLAQFLDAEELFTVTKQGFEFFERAFDLAYPFGKYDQLFVPEFNAGAMENAGAVTILEDYVFRSRTTDAAYERRAETILHEMAHMWFGDLVTMRWWDDLWLNESFASYMAVLAQAEATRWTNAWTTFANIEKTWAYRQDQLPSTHPISAHVPDIESVHANFDGITYAKGASVLKQLVAWVGREQFFSGLRVYFDRHAWSNTSLRDLLSVLEDASGRDLSLWSKEWLETAGVNTIRPRFSVDAEGRFTDFAVVQEATSDHPQLRSHRLAIGLYDRTEQGLVRREQVELDVTGAETPVPQLVGVPRGDLVLVNDDDLTYGKIRLDSDSLATITGSIGEIADPLARALCWAAAWDMTRDAEMAARDYLRLVLAGIDAETDIGVVQSLLRQAQLAVERFAVPDFHDTGLAMLADGCERLLLAAAPGSDFQLAFIRALAACAHSDAHLNLIAELLDGRRELPGLTVDTELRWTLLRRLVVTGRADEAAIETELARDTTAAGKRHALSLQASRPTGGAKAAAWASVVDSDALPNAEQAAIIAGFQQADDLELLRPYVGRYLAEVARLWEERTPEMASTLVEGLFPYQLIDPDTLTLVDRYIEEERPVPALRRHLVEGRDGLARALRAQACDAAAATA